MAASGTSTSPPTRLLRQRTLPAPVLRGTPPRFTHPGGTESIIINALTPFFMANNSDLGQLAEKRIFFGKLCEQIKIALEEGLPCVNVNYDGRWGELPILPPEAGFEIRRMTLHEQWSQPRIDTGATMPANLAVLALSSSPSSLALPSRKGSLPVHLVALPDAMGWRINKLYSLPKNDLNKLIHAATGLVEVILNTRLGNTSDDLSLTERARCLKAVEVTMRELANAPGLDESAVQPCLEKIAQALREIDLEFHREDVPSAIRRIEGFFAGLTLLRTCATRDLPAALGNCRKTAGVILHSHCSPVMKAELLRRLVREMNYFANLPGAGQAKEMERRRLVGDAFREFIVPNLPPREALPPEATVAKRLHEDMERQLRVAGVYVQAHPQVVNA